MEAYLGKENIVTSASITSLIRPKINSPNQRIIIKGTTPAEFGGKSFHVSCEKLVVGIPQTPQALASFDLDNRENALFSSVKFRFYFIGTVNITGPITNLSQDGFFNLVHLDITKPPYFNVVNTWIAFIVQVPYAPAVIYASSDVPTTNAAFRAKVTEELKLIPSTLVTSFQINEFFFHEYYAYPSDQMLADPVGFYTRMNRLQGHRNTFWVGALYSGLQAHHSIMDKTFRLVMNNKLFPRKKPFKTHHLLHPSPPEEEHYSFGIESDQGEGHEDL